MARSRNIKPAFFDNSELGSQNSDIRLLFIALWQLADREGILEYNPAVIKRYCFGYRDGITENDIVGYITVISRLDNGDTLSIRKLDNKQYLIITNFERHQNPHHTEKKGKLPPLKALLEAGCEDLTVITPLSHGENPADSLLLIPDSSNNSHYQKDAHARPGKPPKEKPELEDLSIEHIQPWIDQQAVNAKAITIDVREELQRFKAHYLAYDGKDKNGNAICDWVAKLGGWILNEQKQQKHGAKNETGRHSQSRSVQAQTLPAAGTGDRKSRLDKGFNDIIAKRNAEWDAKQQTIDITPNPGLPRLSELP